MIEDIFRGLLGIPPSSNKIQSDLQKMKIETDVWFNDLIPWIKENEIELLSLTQDKKNSKHGIDRWIKGTFQSIYTEPMFTFAYVDYLKGKGKNALLQIRTKSHEFVYRIKKKGVEVYVDGQYVAFITHEAVMISVKTRRQLGRISEVSQQYFGIIIGEREIAHLLNPEKIDRVNPRAFVILEKMSDQELLLFSAISLVEIVMRTNRLY